MKKLFTLLLALVATTALWAEDFEVDGIYYKILKDKTNEVEVTSGSSRYTGSVTIPQTVTYNGTTYSVTSIGDDAFAYCSGLTSVTISNSVTSIGYRAFYDCSSLTSITIPNNVTSIEQYAFSNCSSLTSIIVEDTNSTYDSRDNCNAIIETATNTLIVGCQKTTIPNSVTSIGDDAFYGCSRLTSITIPNSVTSIGECAFIGCSGLTSITIPNSVTSIGYGAFYDCSSLTSPIFNAHCFAYMPTSYKGEYIILEGIKQIAGGAFIDCAGLVSITIPDSVITIGDLTFAACSGLTSVTIGNSVTSIGDDAFNGCSGLTSITIPNSVTSIGYGAFYDCSSLTSITIPNNVTSIEMAFRGCSSLTSVVWNAKNCADFSSSSPFYHIRSQITSFTFGDSVQHIPAYMCYGMEKLTSVTIPSSVTSIGIYAFAGCSSLPVENSLRYADTYLVEAVDKTLSTYSIKEGTKWIGSEAFYKCSGLTSVTIGNSVTSIGDDAFNGCSGLTSITIPNSVTRIGSSAFSGCSGLTSVVWNAKNYADFSYSSSPFYDLRSQITSFTFGDSVQHIPAYMCYKMSNLTSITIGNSVTSIGGYAFWECESLTSISIPNSVTNIGNHAFYDCFGLTSPIYNAHCFAYMPRSYKGAYIVPEGIKQIAGSAFSSCYALTSITIPNSVTTIGAHAFARCSRLTSITCKAITPPAIEEYSFTTDNNVYMYIPCGTYKKYFSAWHNNLMDYGEFYIVESQVFDIVMSSSNEDYGIAQVEENSCDKINISATANQGYHFVQWSDGNTDNPRVLVLTQDTALTAEFALNQYQISLATDNSEMGSVQGAGTYDYLTEIEISATANYGYHFTQWNDGNTDNPRTVQATEDKAYTALFEKNIYTITTTWDNQMGSVSAPDSAEYLDEITISATANYGYHFVQWSDGNTDNPRTLVLTQDTALTAEFALTLSGQCGDNLYWAYDEANKTISITGSGDMYDYTKSTQPWLLFQEQITEVTTSNTTTSIGASAFEGCVRLGKVSLGYGMENIAAKAFAECKRLYDIYVYATYPPFADESSFANYNVDLYIPCESKRDYEYDIVWGKFKYIECIGAESDETGGDDVTVTPGSNDVTITWPTEDEADTYSIVITKDGEVFCTLTFNSNGQLLNIAFAPGREGNRPAQYAEQANNGYRFTVTGLDESTKYAYNLDVNDSLGKTIKSYEGEFTTQSTTALDNTHSQSPITNCQKLIRDGQLLIIRDGKTYNAQGVVMNP